MSIPFSCDLINDLEENRIQNINSIVDSVTLSELDNDENSSANTEILFCAVKEEEIEVKDIDVIIVKQEKNSEQALHINIVDVRSESVDHETNDIEDENSSNDDESNYFDYENISIDIKDEPIL